VVGPPCPPDHTPPLRLKAPRRTVADPCQAKLWASNRAAGGMPSKYRRLLKGDESLRGRGMVTVLASLCSRGGIEGEEGLRVIRSNCGGWDTHSLTETISRARRSANAARA
jgi:hypothetical protein